MLLRPLSYEQRFSKDYILESGYLITLKMIKGLAGSFYSQQDLFMTYLATLSDVLFCILSYKYNDLSLILLKYIPINDLVDHAYGNHQL